MDNPVEKQIISWLKAQKKACGFYLHLTVLAGVLTGVCLVVQAYLIAGVLHGIIIQARPRSDFTFVFGALLGLIFLRAVFAFARERFAFEAGMHLRREIRRAVLDKLGQLGPAFVGGKPAGSWASIVLEQVEDLHDYYARYVPQMVLAGFVPLTILAAVIPMNWAAGLLLLGTAPLIPLFMVLVGMGAASANQKHFKALSQLSGHFMDRLKGLSTLKLFNRGEAELEVIEAASESFRQKTMAVLRIAFLSSAVLEFFSAVSIALIAVYFGLGYLGYMDFGNYGGPFSLFTGMFVLILAPEYYQPLRDLGTHYHARAQAAGAAEELMALMAYQVPSASSQTPEIRPEALAPELPVTLVAKDYIVKSLSGEILAGPLSFKVNAADHVAVVGPSGAGKTSLLNGILGFLPYEGSLTVNGEEFNRLSMDGWRRQLAWLGQDPVLFRGSIRENVALADPDMDDDTIRALLAKARVMDFVDAQAEGLDHPVGEQMTGVSVGVAQRIALARALGQGAGLFVLDEPTASLDRHSEQAVRESLAEAMVEASCLMVTHRLDELDRMDGILVMDGGRIVQQGRFDFLSRTPGLFRQMQEGCAKTAAIHTGGQIR
ncbi:MAG TPA: cysteine/glutathione ABC transporter permease/ATP-binding protein CydD [Desulfobacteraceae bacterium]|nr:cysteine/glutathione ABC transporter permease/ATP-binding protein CydD [Desulfobacteraceae bacterium]